MEAVDDSQTARRRLAARHVAAVHTLVEVEERHPDADNEGLPAAGWTLVAGDSWFRLSVGAQAKSR